MRRLSLTLLATVLLLIAGPARATVLMFMSTQELTDQSTLVMEVTVLHQEVVELDHLYTDTYVLVSGEVHKGEAASGQILVLRTIGGNTSGVSLHVAGMARFKLGEQALIFASPARAPRSDGRLMVMGAALGKYAIYTDKEGVQRVRRDLSSASVADFSPKGKFRVGGATGAVAGERPTLASLRADIARCVTTAKVKPVKAEGGAK